MNAGSIVVTVDADYSTLSKKVGEAKRVAEQSGKEMGKGASGGFGETFRKGVMEQLKGVGMAILGIQAAQSFAKGFAEYIRQDKTLSEAYIDSVKRIPLVGALAELVEAAYDRATGNLPAPQISESERQVQEMRRKAALERADEEMARQKAIEDSLKRAATLEQETRRAGLLADLSSSMAADVRIRKAGELLALEEEMLRVQREAEASAAVTEQEQTAIRSAFEERMRAVQDEFVERKKRIEKEESDRLKAQADLAAKAKADAEELEILRIEAATEEFRYAMAQQEAIKRAEEESLATRIEAQRAGVGSVSTFAGEFRFDSYPETEKRRNDNRMVDELKKIRERIAVGGFA